MVAYLTGPDSGPRSTYSFANWNKRIISVSTKMNIEFKSDDAWEYKGFSAIIYFIPILNKECESWLDMKKKILNSPNYPQEHHRSIKCNWLITADHDSYITLNFLELYVRSNSKNLITIEHIYVHNS